MIVNSFNFGLPNMINSRVIVIVIFLLSLSLGSFTSCKEPSTGPETRTDSLVLKFIDSELTSATLSLHTVSVTLPATLFLTRNLDTVQTVFLHQPDTTMLDTALTPSTTYIWQAVLAKSTLKSKPVSAKTMDTTVVQYTWQIWEFGDIGSSSLYDVAIINENDIWAVGEIQLTDSAFADKGIIGAIHWDGAKWTPKIITAWHGTGFNGVKIKSIELINNSLFLATSGSLLKYTPDSVYQLALFPKPYPEVFTHQINDMWGDSEGNIWFVGYNGGLFHYSGNGKFEDFSLPTFIPFITVSSSVDGKLFATGGDYLTTNQNFLYQLTPGPFKLIQTPFESYPMAISQSKENELWLGGFGGTFIGSGSGTKLKWTKVDNGITADIAYVKKNEVYGVGWPAIWQFNGMRTHALWSTEDRIQLLEVQVKGDLLVAVGDHHEKAFIIMGKRRP